MDEIKSAYDMGHEVGYYEEEDEECPFPEGSPEYDQWWDGYFRGTQDI